MTANLPILGPVVLGLMFIILRLTFKYYRKPRRDRSRDRTNIRTATGSSHSSSVAIDKAIAPDCIVCFNPLTSSITLTRMATSAWRHEIDVCLPCIAKSIVVDLDSKEADQIRCPSCPQLVGYQDVKALVGPQTFERYGPSSTPTRVSEYDRSYLQIRTLHTSIMDQDYQFSCLPSWDSPVWRPV